MPGNVVRPTTELMLMMRPDLRARIAGSTARVTVSTPNTLVANWRCTSGPLRISTGPARANPAQLTSTSTPAPPVAASILAQAWRTEPSSVTSRPMAWMFGVAAARPASTSWRRAAAKTRCPRRASSAAVARPIPELAPVTSTVSRVVIAGSLGHGPRPPGHLKTDRFTRRQYTDLFPRATAGHKLGDVTTPTRPTPRQRLLDAAADLFYRQGIGAVGVDLVSKQAGVSKRTLYQQFGSKDRLIAESLDAHGAAIIGHYIPAEDPGAPARQQILAVFDGLSGWTASETFRGCPFVNTATELADPGHPARQIARDHKLRLRDYFARHAERGQAKDPQRLADQLMVVFDGAIVQAVMGTMRHSDAARSAAQALLDAHGIP